MENAARKFFSPKPGLMYTATLGLGLHIDSKTLGPRRGGSQHRGNMRRVTRHHKDLSKLSRGRERLIRHCSCSCSFCGGTSLEMNSLQKKKKNSIRLFVSHLLCLCLRRAVPVHADDPSIPWVYKKGLYSIHLTQNSLKPLDQGASLFGSCSAYSPLTL